MTIWTIYKPHARGRDRLVAIAPNRSIRAPNRSVTYILTKKERKSYGIIIIQNMYLLYTVHSGWLYGVVSGSWVWTFLAIFMAMLLWSIR